MKIVRYLIDMTVSLLGKILKNRKLSKLVRHNSGKVCVNLGCGLAIAPGWINVDASFNAIIAGSPRFFLSIFYKLSGSNRYYSLAEYSDLLSENTFVFHDLSKGSPFDPNTIDYIYSSHFFEHLFKKDAARLFSDCYRALKNGGVMRVAVPDLEYAIELYKKDGAKNMLENYFFVDDLNSYLARHKYMYDFVLLKEALEIAGFKNIVKCSFSVGAVPDLELLDNRPEETLFVEAYK